MHDASVNLCASHRRPGFKPSKPNLDEVMRKLRIVRWAQPLPESRCSISRLPPRPQLARSWGCVPSDGACFVSSLPVYA